jgi:hypothetical protein
MIVIFEAKPIETAPRGEMLMLWQGRVWLPGMWQGGWFTAFGTECQPLPTLWAHCREMDPAPAPESVAANELEDVETGEAKTGKEEIDG